MIRALTHLLICLTISLMLAVTGAQAAAARLIMAVEAETTTEAIICGAEGAHLVTLNAAGVPVTRKAPHDCANCPECAQAAVAVLPEHCPPGSSVETRTDLAPGLTGIELLPIRVAGQVQARAPPKEY